MPTLRIDTYTMPSADLGGENPLPALRPYTSASTGGMTGTYLPYRTQDRYDRDRKPVEHRVAILENDKLRATFLLNLGGRLWSLYHKPTGRELLETNPVFQPANLAIRNAWFSGGVEWNVSIIGHCPFTCSPLFAAEIQGPNGPALRLYEFERIRQAVFEIDFHLPEGSDFLYVRPRITNTQDRDIEMYWWSNIAVNETEDTRVIAPTDEAWEHSYDSNGLAKFDLRSQPDRCYPARAKNAGDVFFAIPENHRPWEAAVDADGAGLLHASTSRLYGRKLFYWGTNTGGRKWQEYLSEPGQAYIEIQAGLAPTQGQYASMPAGAVWTWLEAYGPLQVPKEVAHAPAWADAWRGVDPIVDAVVPFEKLQKGLAFLDGREDRVVRDLQKGSGWGALEERRRGVTFSPGAAFSPESIGEPERPWLHLLTQGFLPQIPAKAEPGAFMVQSDWIPKLRESAASGKGDHWLTWYHLGVALWNAGERQEAETAWRKSIEREPSPWAYRDLAVAAELGGDARRAADLIVQAARLLPMEKALVHQACEALSAIEASEELRSFAAGLPAQSRGLPRVRLALARADLACGDFASVEEFFTQPLEVVDIREGEVSLSELWFDLKAAEEAGRLGVPVDEALKERVRRECPPPEGFDFRMSE